MKKILLFIIFSFYIFCSAQEILDNLEIVHKEVKQKQTEVNIFFDRDDLLIKFDFNKNPSQELIFMVDSILQRVTLDLSHANGYVSAMEIDYLQMKSILEKPLILKRELNSSEAYFITSFFQDYMANYDLFFKSLDEFSKKILTIFDEEFRNYSAKKNIVPYEVIIGIPNKENEGVIEKEQNFLTTKDDSITLIYYFDELPPKTYYMNFELIGPDNNMKKMEFPMIRKLQNFSPNAWYWHFETVEDLKNKKGEWTVNFIIDDKVVNTSHFTLK